MNGQRVKHAYILRQAQDERVWWMFNGADVSRILFFSLILSLSKDGIHAIDQQGISKEVTRIAQAESVPEAVQRGFDLCARSAAGEFVGLTLGLAAGVSAAGAGLGLLYDLGTAARAAEGVELGQVSEFGQTFGSAAQAGSEIEGGLSSGLENLSTGAASTYSPKLMGAIQKAYPGLEDAEYISKYLQMDNFLKNIVEGGFTGTKIGAALGGTAGAIAGVAKGATVGLPSSIKGHESGIDQCYSAVAQAARVTINRNLHDGARQGFLWIDNQTGAEITVILQWVWGRQECKVPAANNTSHALWALGMGILQSITITQPGARSLTLSRNVPVPINAVIGARIQITSDRALTAASLRGVSVS